MKIAHTPQKKVITETILNKFIISVFSYLSIMKSSLVIYL